MKRAKGFTLIEILIAFSLSGLIFVLLFASLWQTQKFREKGEQRQRATQKSRILSDRLSWLLKGAYPYSIKEEGKILIFFKGTPRSLGFVTTSVDRYSNEPWDRAGLKWVELSGGENGLMMRENIYFLRENLDSQGGSERVLDPDVKDIEFSYLYIDGTGNEIWTSEWEPKEKERLPLGVRVRVGVEINGKRFDVPEIFVKIMSGQ